jgi:hypothetical protein
VENKDYKKARKTLEPEQWFQDLPDEIKKMAIEQEIQWNRPVSKIENVLYNIAFLSKKKTYRKWLHHKAIKFPYYINKKIENQQVVKEKIKFLQPYIAAKIMHTDNA